MNEVNWVVSLLAGALLSIPISLFVNLWTPKVQEWITRRAISSKGKNLERLKKEYSMVKELKDNPEKLRLSVYRTLIDTVGRIFGLVIFVQVLAMGIPLDFSHISPPVLFVWAIFILGAMFGDPTLSLRANLTRVVDFEKYESETLKEIATLTEDIAS